MPTPLATSMEPLLSVPLDVVSVIVNVAPVCPSMPSPPHSKVNIDVNFHVHVPLNTPLKITPFGTPGEEPNPVTMKNPPSANVELPVPVPLVRAPVVKSTTPRLLPLIDPYLVNVPPLKDKPLAETKMVPPVLEMSVASADAASGSTKYASKIQNAFRIPPLHFLLEGSNFSCSNQPCVRADKRGQ